MAKKAAAKRKVSWPIGPPDEEVRLRCVEAAAKSGDSFASVLEAAKVYYTFVTDKQAPTL